MNSTHNYLFISDLHLSEGWNPQTGLLHRNEDFFHDAALAQLLAYHVSLTYDPNVPDCYQKPWKLVINGDIFDFLQVTSTPKDKDGVVTIHAVDETGQPLQLQKKLSENEKKFGLGTSSAEIVWKLDRIAAGHPLFFQALAWFLAHEGNEIVLMKGNHDIEIYWTAVQVRMAQLLEIAYMQWFTAVNPESFLWRDDALPDALPWQKVQKALHFPSLYLYEEGIFYAEHGCQYDPANAFKNFAAPLLPRRPDAAPDDPDVIELPEGSLFVRYFFNDVEKIHPFADNMKPISRYIFWLVRHAPTSLFSFLTILLPDYLRTKREIRKKTKNQQVQNQQPASNNFEKVLFTLQARSREKLRQGSHSATRRMIMSVLFVVVMVLLLAMGVRLLATGDYLWMGITAVFALVSLFLSSYLFQSLDKLLEMEFLYEAAVQIAQLINSPQTESLHSVPYLIFGHDHNASMRLIPTQGDQNAPPFRQWYVNTGAWVPVFSEEERLLRDDEQLTFLRLVPDRVKNGRDVPELLQWVPGAPKPMPVRLLD